MKDWTGGRASVFKTLGASNHADHDRQREDYYATEPKATQLLCTLESFTSDIWEPACGEGHIAKELKKHGYNVRASDLIDRGYGDIGDFLAIDNQYWGGQSSPTHRTDVLRNSSRKLLPSYHQDRKLPCF